MIFIFSSNEKTLTIAVAKLKQTCVGSHSMSSKETVSTKEYVIFVTRSTKIYFAHKNRFEFVLCSVQPTYLGVTEPISTAKPDEKALKSSEALVEILKSFDLFETEDEARHRERVLGQLNVIVQKWVFDVSVNKVCILFILFDML